MLGECVEGDLAVPKVVAGRQFIEITPAFGVPAEVEGQADGTYLIRDGFCSSLVSRLAASEPVDEKDAWSMPSVVLWFEEGSGQVAARRREIVGRALHHSNLLVVEVGSHSVISDTMPPLADEYRSRPNTHVCRQGSLDE
jgi:hypothetical protein